MKKSIFMTVSYNFMSIKRAPYLKKEGRKDPIEKKYIILCHPFFISYRYQNLNSSETDPHEIKLYVAFKILIFQKYGDF